MYNYSRCHRCSNFNQILIPEHGLTLIPNFFEFEMTGTCVPAAYCCTCSWMPEKLHINLLILLSFSRKSWHQWKSFSHLSTMHPKWLHLTILFLLRVIYSFLHTLGTWQGQWKVIVVLWDIEKPFCLIGNVFSHIVFYKIFIFPQFLYFPLYSYPLWCRFGIVIIANFLKFPLFIRKALVRLFDKVDRGTMKEGRNLSNRVIEIHKRRYTDLNSYHKYGYIFQISCHWHAGMLVKLWCAFICLFVIYLFTV